MTELTPEQLEAAARLLCKKREIDPDKRVFIDHGHAQGSGYLCDAWQNVANEIEIMYECLYAVYTVISNNEGDSNGEGGSSSEGESPVDAPEARPEES